MNNKKLRQIIRYNANASRSSWPIKIISGDSNPKIKGKGYYYTTLSGRLVRYPNAYRRAFGKPIYNHSTLRIEVGEDWAMHMGLLSKKLTKI